MILAFMEMPYDFDLPCVCMGFTHLVHFLLSYLYFLLFISYSFILFIKKIDKIIYLTN